MITDEIPEFPVDFRLAEEAVHVISITVYRILGWFDRLNFEGMFEKFQQEVWDSYLDLRNRHALPSGLENLNRSNLRRYAQSVLADRYDRKDDEVIRQFFDPKNRYTDNEERIRRFELDGFRPLISFLKGETRRPDERIVKILAWLIDFEPRPYGEWLKAEGMAPPTMDGRETNKGQPTDTIIDQNADTDTPPTGPKYPRRTLYIITALVIGLSAYLIIKPVDCWEKQCMYWAADHYVSVCCEKQLPGAAIVAIRPYELEHFQRITRPDTLTADHANKVWYSKIDNRVEFFTSPATRHPLRHDRLIKPATAHIIEKYGGQNAARERQGINPSTYKPHLL